jgi:hypothetical protein
MMAVLSSIWAASSVTASSITTSITFQTTGPVGLQAGNAVSPVIFHGIADGSIVAWQPFTLGEFEVNASAHGPVDMPFVVIFWAKTVDGVTPEPNESPVLLLGRMVGTLDDGPKSSLRAIIDQGPQFTDPKYYNPHVVSPFRLGDLIRTSSWRLSRRDPKHWLEEANPVFLVGY